MRAIYKYQLYDGRTLVGNIEKFLKLDYQNGIPTVWAIFNDELPETTYKIRVYGTGWELESNINASTYLGTLEDGIYIWHYFAIPEGKEREKTYNIDDIYNKFLDKEFAMDTDKAIEYNNAFTEIIRQVIKEAPVSMR